MLVLVDKTTQCHRCTAEGCTKPAVYGPVGAVTSPSDLSVIVSLHLPFNAVYCKEHAEQQQKKDGIPVWNVVNRLCEMMGDCIGE
jgi:hypothetical protein